MSLQIGRVILGEADIRPFEETWSNDERTVTLKGIAHTAQPLSVAALSALHDDILGLGGSLVAVVFDTKDHRNGYYTVLDSKSSLIHLEGEQVVMVTWEVSLRREGSVSEVDIETRLAGPLSRANDHTLTGDRWTAPSIGHTAFWANSETPGVVDRTGSEGEIQVYTELPDDLPAVRWACDPLVYDVGRARLLDGSLERTGTGISLSVAGWEVHNSLIGVRWNGDKFELRYHEGVSWKTITFRPLVDTDDLPNPHAVSVLYNGLERVTIRLVWTIASGRVTADITVRRGARFFEVVMKKPVASTMALELVTPQASTSFTGGLRATSNDANGDRYVLSSARSFTADTTNGKITKNATTRLDAMVGVEIDGSSAVAGDTAADLTAQYLGSPSETILAVRR